MTRSETRRSLVDQLREERPLDAAAARAAVRAVSLMNEAFSQSDLGARRELAEAVGVSEGRISQLLNGDGNVRVSTLARLLKATGFDLELSLAGVDDSPKRSSRRYRDKARTTESPAYVTVRTDTSVAEGPDGPGIEEHQTVELSSRHPKQELIGSVVEWAGTVEFSEAGGSRLLRYTDETSDPVKAASAPRSRAHA